MFSPFLRPTFQKSMFCAPPDSKPLTAGAAAIVLVALVSPLQGSGVFRLCPLCLGV
jgi:hypothetical protein